jgi:hypothetical protein
MRLNALLLCVVSSYLTTTEAQVLATQMMEAQETDQLPTFIYSYLLNSDQLWRTHLVTGEQACYTVQAYRLQKGCCWSELSGGSLLITGGYPNAREVVRIDTRREFAVSRRPPMPTPKTFHCAVYHKHCLYVFGGYYGKYLDQCERYVCAEDRWEPLPPLLQACYGMSGGVVYEGSLYALRAYNDRTVDLIQKLSLETLTWEAVQFRLPQADKHICCFKHDSQVYFIVNKTLYSLQTLQALKTLPSEIRSSCGPSHYSRGALYCSSDMGPAMMIEIGSLTNQT